jgi:hypothetical protein
MPQASDELRELINFICPNNGMSDEGPVKFLVERGYKLRDNYEWDMPKEEHWVSDKELLCLRFLVEEWDYGGIVTTVS